MGAAEHASCLARANRRYGCRTLTRAAGLLSSIVLAASCASVGPAVRSAPTPRAIASATATEARSSASASPTPSAPRATLEVVATIPVGTRPFYMAATADAVWVANSGSGTVSRIDPRSNTVVATIPVGSLTDTLFGSPTAVATDGSAVWVAKSAERALARIDPASNRLTTTIPLAVEPYAIAVNADDLWVTSFRSNQLLRV